MKKIMFALAFLMFASTCVLAHNPYNRHLTISVGTFYDELSPYGEWLNSPDYGFVWRPYLDNNEDFTPYSTAGNWVYTDYGWTWVSDYRWGWAPFHYGRWTYDEWLGWMWIPGTEWAPAWVTWGSYNDCWAWAPMGPDIRVDVSFTWHAPHFWWTFVPFRHFISGNWYAHRYTRPVQVTNITYITNVYYNNDYRHDNGNWYYGPRVNDVERHLNKRVNKMKVVDSDKPENLVARNDRVKVYRPSVTSNRADVRPEKYRTVENTRPAKRDVPSSGKVKGRYETMTPPVRIEHRGTERNSVTTTEPKRIEHRGTERNNVTTTEPKRIEHRGTERNNVTTTEPKRIEHKGTERKAVKETATRKEVAQSSAQAKKKEESKRGR